MRINHALIVLVSVTFGCATGKLLCSEELFDGLGGSLPSPKSTSAYSKCVQGAVLTVPCPNGHNFDTHTKECLFDPAAQEARMEASYQFEELCNNPNTVEIFPNPTNCSQYIICYGLVPIEQSCVNGLLFNPQLNSCDIPSNVICGYSCPAVDDPYNPVWLPDARLEDCSRHYLCFQGNPLLFYCYNNLYFDIVSRTCTYPQYSACSVPGVYCNTNTTVNIANPRSCTSYYMCEDGFPHFRNCGFEEYFSEALGVCIPGSCEPGTTTTAGSTTFDPSSTTVSPGTTPSLTSTTDLNTPTGDFTSTTPPLTTTDFTTQFTTPDTSSTPAGTSTTPETTTGLLTESTSTSLSTEEVSTTTTSFESTTAIESTTFPTEPESTTFAPTTPEITTSVETTTPDTPSTTTTSPATPETTSEFITDSTSVEASTQEVSTTTTPIESTTATESTTFPTEPETTTTPELTTSTLETTSELVTTTSTQEISTTTAESSTSELTETTTVESTTTSTDSTTTQPETTATTEMVTIDPNEVCAGLGIVILPYPDNCIMYIVCINGIGGVSTCASGEIFNPVSMTCAPGDQETCTLT